MSADKDLKIVILPEAQEQFDRIVAYHPGAKESIASLFANMRQAHHDVQTGKYKSFEEAMEAITGNRPIPIDQDEDDE